MKINIIGMLLPEIITIIGVISAIHIPLLQLKVPAHKSVVKFMEPGQLLVVLILLLAI